MKRWALLAAAASIVTAATLPAPAATQSSTYVAGVGVKSNVQRSTPTQANVGVGGTSFQNVTSTPLSIRVNDSAAGTGKVLFNVCQIGTGTQCGTPGSRVKWFCANNNSVQPLSGPGFVANETVHVWVFADETFGGLWAGNIACSGALASTGTITLTY